MKHILFLIAALGLIALSTIHAEVVSLTLDNFATHINTKNPDQKFFIKAYAPWCGHCRSMAAAWESLGKSDVANTVVIGQMDCTVEKELCQRFDILGFPTLLYGQGDKYGNYNGPRGYSELAEFAEGAFTGLDADMPSVEPPFLAQYLSPENLQLVRELEHDLIEIWNIRRNALGFIVTAAFLMGMAFFAACCQRKRERQVVKEKKD